MTDGIIGFYCSSCKNKHAGLPTESRCGGYIDEERRRGGAYGRPYHQGSNREGRKSERDARRHPFRLAVWPFILSKS